GGGRPRGEGGWSPSGFPPQRGWFSGGLSVLNPAITAGLGTNAIQRQLNVVESLHVALGPHETKVGVDVRRLMPTSAFSPYSLSYVFNSAAAAIAGTISNGQVLTTDPSDRSGR